MQPTIAPKYALPGFGGLASTLGHDCLVLVAAAVSARFLSEHPGAPAVLMALLLGIASNFLFEEGTCKPGNWVGASGFPDFRRIRVHGQDRAVWRRHLKPQKELNHATA